MNHPRRTLLEEPCRHRFRQPSWCSTATAQANRFSDALYSKDALQTLIECPWANKGQWTVFPEDKLALTDPPPRVKACLLNTTLTAQLQWEPKMWRRSNRDLLRPGRSYHPTPESPLRRSIHLVVCEKAAATQPALKWATANRPENSLAICIGSQSLLKAIERRSPVTHQGTKKSFPTTLQTL